MTVTEQNRLLVFERRVLRKIYGPIQDKDGVWGIKTNEELERLIKGKKYCTIHKSAKITLGGTCHQNGGNKNCPKIN
jgi:hypothetical protein